jgi:hypothetical protein
MHFLIAVSLCRALKRTFDVNYGRITALICVLAASSSSRAGLSVSLENLKPGTADWQLSRPALHREIEGYASDSSVNRGSGISLFVNTTNSTYTIELFRMGWYGGKGARLVSGPITRTGQIQPLPVRDEASGMAECNWVDPWVVVTASSEAEQDAWTTGVYLARLTGSDDGRQSYIIFVVRDDDRPSDFLFQVPTTTYQAYNTWGGKSLYYQFSSDMVAATKVSFNRPYGTRPDTVSPYSVGAGEFLSPVVQTSGWDYNTLRWMEREGYDVAYATSEDTHSGRARLTQRKAFLSIGHDEYWSWGMRTNIEAARDQGVHVGSFSSNTSYWQIRLEPSPITGGSERVLVCYKSLDDPLFKTTDSYLTTTHWRDAPVNYPESNLLGIRFIYNSLNSDIIMDQCDGWLTANTNLKPGTILPGLLGYEVDAIPDDLPFQVQRLAHSPFYIFDWRTQTYNQNFSDMVLHRVASGAFVFATGSMQWAWGLDNFGAPDIRLDLINPDVQQMTRNLLGRFSGSPASRVTFVKSEASSGGHWKGRYGVEGFLFPTATNLPPYVNIGKDQEILATEAVLDDNSAGLESLTDTTRIQTVFSSQKMELALDFDSAPHLITLYIAGGTNSESSQSVEVVDADSNEILDRRAVRLTREGAYWTWSVSGKVRLRLEAPHVSVLNGVFFGGSGKASFLDYDLSTHGSWKRIYGRDGAWISQNVLRPPGYAELRIYGGQGPMTVTNFSSRIETFFNTNRITDGLSGEIDLAMKDSEPHEVALYFMRGNPQPSGKVLIVDGLSNRVLDSREVSQAFPDQYLVWNISGHVKIIPGDCILSAVFLSPPKTRPEIELTEPAANSTFEAPARLSLKARISPADAVVDRVEFYNGDQLLATRFSPPFEFNWTNVLIGHYALRAIVYDGLAVNTTSAASDVDVVFPAIYLPPVIHIIYPLSGDTFTAPASLTAACFLNRGTVPLNHTDFFVDHKWVGTSSGLSHAFDGLSAGPHVITANAVDELGGIATSSDVLIQVAMPEAQGTFLLTDVMSHGNWKGLFGGEGIIIPGVVTNLPSEIVVTNFAARSFGWVDQTGDLRALQYPNIDSRIASAWTDDLEISMEVSFLDGRYHSLALYLLDWDGGGRVENISIYDAGSDRLLDTREISEFKGGEYSVMAVRGRIKLQIRTQNSGNTVLSGLFFDTFELPDLTSLRLRCTSKVLQNGNLAMVISGKPYTAYVLEKSGDLISWMEVETRKSSTGIVPFSAAQTAADGASFFRIRERESEQQN